MSKALEDKSDGIFVKTKSVVSNKTVLNLTARKLFNKANIKDSQPV